MGADIGAFKTQPEAAIMAEIERSRPPAGAGYAAADERYRQRQQAAQQVLQLRKADPAGYATANTPELKGLRARIDDPATPAEQRPALVQQFVRDNLAEQQRLGIREPRVLTPSQADAIAQRAMSAQRPEDSANLISGLEAEYGPHFPRVFGELVRDKKIAGELMVIPNLPSQTAREAVSRLARVKESDLTQGIDASDQKTIKEAVVGRMEEFARAVPIMSEQAAGFVNSYETTLRKLAYQFTVAGQAPADAVENAHALLLGQYQFDGTMRMPRAVDANAVRNGAAERLRRDLGDIDVPADQITGARTPDEVRAEWVSTVQARPQWYTTDDDSGLSLWATGSNGVRYRVTRGGRPVSYTWAELQTRPQEAMAPGGPVAPPPGVTEAQRRAAEVRAYGRARAEEMQRQRDAR